MFITGVNGVHRVLFEWKDMVKVTKNKAERVGERNREQSLGV